ncbi:MAG: hypothetical protein PF517_15095 [Salinivirgaceae bacterium]|jgi:hypothetical protein|nr:hypothetical protein [Salinivirgaceae bacterium]
MKRNNQTKNILCAIIILISIFPSGKIIAQFPVFEASVTKEIYFKNMPSASGIVKFQDNYFIIGDDSPYLFKLNSEFQLIKKIKIFSDKKIKNDRLPKKLKPDFECITIVPWGNDSDLLVFGSGSTKEREVMIRIDIDEGKESIKSYSLKEFYKHLTKKIPENRKLNIEGAGYWNNYLILLNRSDNTLFKIDLDDFKEHIRGKDVPKIKSIKFNLPSINGILAKFSGMTVLPNEDIIVFTASVENDPNWIINENIICSYLGIIDLNQLENNEPICKLIKINNNLIQEKVESIYVIDKSDTLIKLAGVIDNDNGSSKLLKIDFKKL